MLLSKPLRAICLILASALHRLAHLPADWEATDEHEEFTGADMLARPIGNDAPDVGTALPDNRTNVPAVVFTGGADVAAVFSTRDPDMSALPMAAAVRPPEPIYTMTAAAGGFTREQYLATPGWDDDTLVAQGFMTVTYPKPPAPSTVAVPAPPIALVVGMGTSPTPAAAPQPAQPPAAVATTAAPAATSHAGSVELDVNGLPWDQRIHGGGKSKTNAGAWIKRKGVQPGIVAQVEAELRQRPAPVAVAAAAPFVPLQAAPAPVAVPAAAVPQAPVAAPAPPALLGNSLTPAQQAVAAARAAAVASLPAGVPATFSELLTWASTNNLGSLFGPTAAHLGIPSFGLLATTYHTPENVGKAYNFMASNRAA